MAQHLRALVPAEGLSLIPGTYLVVYNQYNSSSKESNTLF